MPRGGEKRVRCIRCGLTVADLWRWCPECGGEIAGQHPEIDLRGTDSQFVVEWSESAEEQREHRQSDRRDPSRPTRRLARVLTVRSGEV